MEFRARKNDMTFKQLRKYEDKLQTVMYTCKCGHRVVIPRYKDTTICNWCWRTVYRNEREEFKANMEKRLKNGRKDK